MLRTAPWLLCLLLGMALFLQWQQANQARENASAMQEAALEAGSAYLEAGPEYAKVLTMELRDLRAGNTAEGYRALDSLLWILIRHGDSTGSNADSIREAEAYLAEVGDPWQRPTGPVQDH